MFRRFLILICIASSIIGLAQTEKPDSVSVKAKPAVIFNEASLLFFQKQPDLLIPLKMMSITPLTQKYSYGFRRFDETGNIYSKTELLSPLLAKYRDEQKLSLLYSILGTVETGATGYALYQHIKKYGIK